MTDRAKRLILLSFTLFFCLIVAEVALAILMPGLHVYRKLLVKREPYPASYSPFISFTLPKNKVVNDIYTINKDGFRGPVIPSPKASNQKRIVVMGDSYTFGVLVKDNETFAAQLQKKVGKAHVINAGYHAGFSPDSYYVSLVQEEEYYKPDIILIALCMSNDLEDTGDNSWETDPNTGYPTRTRTWRNYRNHEGQSIYLEGNDFPLLLHHVPILRESRFFLALNYFLDRYVIHRRFVGQAERRRRGTERFKTSLKAIDEFAKKRGVKLFFMVIPPYVERASGTMEDHEFAINIIENELKRPYIDLRDVYKQEKDVNKMFIPGDGHFTPYGNQRVAEVLYERFFS